MKHHIKRGVEFFPGHPPVLLPGAAKLLGSNWEGAVGPGQGSWFWLLGWICSLSPAGFLHLLGQCTFSPHWPFCILVCGLDAQSCQLMDTHSPPLGLQTLHQEGAHQAQVQSSEQHSSVAWDASGSRHDLSFP